MADKHKKYGLCHGGNLREIIPDRVACPEKDISAHKRVSRQGQNRGSSAKLTMKSAWLILISAVLLLYPRPASPSGIGIRDFKGTVTVRNSLLHDNTNGIQVTTTNAASTANKTIDNIWVFNNILLDHVRNGVKMDFSNSVGGITLYNNSLDNSYVPNTGDDTENGRFGIQIKNNPSPSIANNTVTNFGRSGIRLQSISNVTVVNNILYSNGSQNYSEVVGDETRHYAFGLQAFASNYSYIVSNTISSNYFSGIGGNLTTGTVGPNNTIRYNGDSTINAGITDCVNGSMQGGVLAWDLPSAGDSLSVCNNNIHDNYNSAVAHNGRGMVYSCANRVVPIFTSPADAVYYYDQSSGTVNHDCGGSVINAANKAFGIVIMGATSDVTVQNCTIQNAAMDAASRATTKNGSIIGAGIFIASEASPLISGNYIFSNGWGLLDDRVYTEAGSSGIQMRCADAATSIINNTIASNANDGLVGRETGGIIGLVTQGNTFRNNGRGGIGLYDGIKRNLEITENTIHSNRRGIGSLSFDGNTLTIANNFIYSNQGTATSSGGIALNDFSSTIFLEANTIRNNSAAKNGGGIGVTASNGTFSFINNEIMNNISSYVGGVGFNDMDGATVYLEGNSVENNSAIKGGGIGVTTSNGAFSFINNKIAGNSATATDFSVGGLGFREITNVLSVIYLSGNSIENNTTPMVGGMGISLSNATVTAINNTVFSNSGNCIGGFGIDTFSGAAFISSNVIYSNYNSKSSLGAGGLAFDYNSGNITVSNNTIYNNFNTATGSGGLGFNHLQSDAVVLIETNFIYSNSGGRVGGMGLINVSTSNITISANTIYNNAESGIGVREGSLFNIVNNMIYSNGLDDIVSGGEHRASGIQLRDSTFANSDISGNTLRNNKYAGITVYTTHGYIGPNNVMQENGNSGSGSCSRLNGPGGGDGAVAVRDLTDTLIISGNVIENNYIGTVTRKDDNGTVRLDGVAVSANGGFWDAGDTVIFINQSDTTINSVDITGGAVWGIAIVENAQNVTIKNCTIHDNGTTANTKGKYGGSLNGGVLIGPGSSVYLDNNSIYNNGVAVQNPGVGGDAGVVLRCSDADTTLVNNTIVNNANDGIDLNDPSGYIGLSGKGNSIGNNGRLGIALNSDSGSNDVTIAYNYVYSNNRGIGVSGEINVSVLNNEIFDNTDQGLCFGGGQTNTGTLSSPSGNTVVLGSGGSYDDMYNDYVLKTNGDPLYAVITDYDGGTKTATLNQNWVSNPSDTYYVMTTYRADAYAQDNNIYSNTMGVGIAYAGSGSDIRIYSNSIYDNTNSGTGPAGVGVTDAQPGAGVLVENNIISNNTGATGNPGGVGIKDSSGLITFSNNSIVNNTGTGVGVKNLFAGADVLIYSNMIDNNSATGSSIGGVGSQNLREGSYLEIDSNSITNNSSTVKAAAVGIRQTSDYTGKYGFVRVSNNTIFSNTTSEDDYTTAIGVTDETESPKIDLSSEKSGVEIIRNSINCDDVLGGGVSVGRVTGGNDSTRYGRVYIRENDIINIDTSETKNYGIRAGNTNNDLGSSSSDYVSFFIQNNTNVDTGLGIGGGQNVTQYLGVLRVTGNTFQNITKAVVYDPIVKLGNDSFLYPDPGDSYPTIHVSGNLFENLDASAFWWAGQATKWDSNKVYTYIDNNLFSTSGPMIWRHHAPQDFYFRDNRGNHTGYHANRKPGSPTVKPAGMIGLDQGWEVDRLYIIGNESSDSQYAAIGADGPDTDVAIKTVLANNTLGSCGYACIGITGGTTVATAHVYGNTIYKGGLLTDGGSNNYPGMGFKLPGTYYFRNNIVYENGNPSYPSDSRGIGVDDSSAIVYFEHNTLVDNYGPGVQANAGATTTAKGNIFYNNDSTCVDCDVYASNYDGGDSTDFADYAGDNFLLSSDSGALDGFAGSIFSSGDPHSLDINGQNRPFNTNYDYGADEYGATGYAPVIDSVIVSQSRDGLGVVNINYNGSDLTDDAVHSEVYYTRPGPAKGYDRGCAYSLLNSGTQWLALEDILVWTSSRSYFPSSARNMTFPWIVRRELPMIEDRAKVRLQANDWFNDSTLANSNIFTIDTMPPRKLANLQETDSASSSISFSWAPAEDDNFLTYEIIYKSGSNQSISRGCAGCTTVDKDNIANLGTAGTSSAQITGLSASTTYSFNIFAVDAYGNSISCYDKSTDASTP